MRSSPALWYHIRAMADPKLSLIIVSDYI